MIKTLGLTLAAVGVMAITAQAIPITGTVRMSGDVTLDTQNLATADAATAFAAVTVVGSPTLAYSGTAGSSVTWKPFSWDPSSAPVNDLWSFISGLWTYTFDLASITTFSQNSSFLNMSGTGTVDITGPGSPYTTTAANWTFQITDSSGATAGSFVFGFSDSNTAVPSVPDGGMTVAMLGLALSGLGLMRRKLVA